MMRKEYRDTDLAVKDDEFMPAALRTFLVGPCVYGLGRGFPDAPSAQARLPKAFAPVHPLTALGAVEREPLESARKGASIAAGARARRADRGTDRWEGPVEGARPFPHRPSAVYVLGQL